MSESTVCIPLPTKKLLEICDFIESNELGLTPTEALLEAFELWSTTNQETATAPVREQDKGYSWKTVFLPNGSSLRMKYKGKFFYAAIQGDQIIYNGEAVTPSEFTWAVTQTSRNAWNDIGIKRPNDKEWINAHALR